MAAKTYVLMDVNNQFMVDMLGKKWSKEFPDAFLFTHKNVARQCAIQSPVNVIFLVTNYGMEDQKGEIVKPTISKK